MRLFILIIPVLMLSACASVFKEQETEANPAVQFVEARVEVVAQDLVSSGKAANMDEAREMAREIVEKEISDQKSAARENEASANYLEEDPKSRAR
ncbi:MAG: hypothetical protein JW942_00305 [Opitutales bacterium]|nr:hypothetical protein [Opitutales bacterium]